MSLENSIGVSNLGPTLEQQDLSLPLEADIEQSEDVATDAKSASKLHARLQTAKRAVQGAIVAAEANHFTNEGIRFSAFGATLAETHNTALGALVLGGSTFLIEGSAGLAAAGLLNGEGTSRVVRWINKQGSKVIPEGSKISPAAEFGVAIVAGTPVLMGLRNIAEPDRTLHQNRKHGLFTASWLAGLAGAGGEVFGKSMENHYTDPKMWAAGVVAVSGLALAVKFSKSLAKTESPKKENPEASMPAERQPAGSSAVRLALKHSPERVQRRAEDIALRRIFRTHGFDIRHVSDGVEGQKALELEQNIWNQEGYGNLAVYEKFIPQSRIFAAFDGDRCVGMNRLFAGSPEVPPFIAEMPIDDPELKQDLIDRGKELKVEEFGTVGVVKELRGGRTFLDICRMAFRDAEQRGVETWGIIMEPERVEKMNKGLAFTFKQIGPAIDYQGGMCAAHIMDFDEVHANMHSIKPELYDWFINQPL